VRPLADGRIDSAGRDTGGPDGALRAVIDLRWMRPGVAGGIENLSRSFLDQLLRLDRSNRYAVLVPAAARRGLDAGDRPNFTFAVADGPVAYTRRLAHAGRRFLHRRSGIGEPPVPEARTPRWLRRFGAEVALSMPGYIHPDVAALPNVLIVPDIQHEYHPEFFPLHELAERRRTYTASAKRAVHICAISEFTRQTLIERLGIPPDRVTTTYPAADPVFQPDSPRRHDSFRVVEKYGLKSGEYLLFPGNTWPHKNHRSAVQALRVLSEAYGLEPVLVCTGSPKAAHDELRAQIRDLRLVGRVRFLGYCPMEDMPGLYEGAAALVFPSLFEGFGIPLLEAMWCDCPVVCSNLASLPEIAGDAALLVDPGSPEALAHAVSRVLTDGELRRALIERGRRRVEHFSWARFVSEVVRILREARHG
jgi:glycosyltransferase involved in cell wall biosynthesis